MKLGQFIDIGIPVPSCQLGCHYCCLPRSYNKNYQEPDLSYQVAHICDALDRFPQKSLINICGWGETLLSKNVIPLVKNILSGGHCVMLVTNGIAKERLENLLDLPQEFRQNLFFKFSYHYLELKKKSLLEKYYSSIKYVQDQNCSFTLEMVPCDEMEPYKEEIKQSCLENLGCLPHLTVPRDDNRNDKGLVSIHSLSEFYKIWHDFDSLLFDLKIKHFNTGPGTFCLAGRNSFILHLESKKLLQCYRGKAVCENFFDAQSPLNLKAIGVHCPEPRCCNIHAFLPLGVLPEFREHTLAEVRNMKLADGRDSLTPPMKSLMSQNLYHNTTNFPRLRFFFDKFLSQAGITGI